MASSPYHEEFSQNTLNQNRNRTFANWPSPFLKTARPCPPQKKDAPGKGSVGPPGQPQFALVFIGLCHSHPQLHSATVTGFKFRFCYTRKLGAKSAQPVTVKKSKKGFA